MRAIFATFADMMRGIMFALMVIITIIAPITLAVIIYSNL